MESQANSIADGTRCLDGIVVADFSRVLAGPTATMMLGDLGATIIKVERPGAGDDTRSWGPPYVGTMSSYFASVNRNKQSITLDLKEGGDLALARDLIDRADVLVENFLPGGMSTFGLDHETVLRANRRLVYCSITGFGSGPGALLPGYDFLVQAVGGLMSITGHPGEPTKVGVALVDVITGLHASIAILAALQERERSGLGQYVEVNLLSSLLASLANQGTAFLNGAGVPVAMGNAHPSIAPYETLRAKESNLAVAIGNDAQFERLCSVLGDIPLALDPRFSSNKQRVSNRAALKEALENLLIKRSASEWTTRCRAKGLAVGPINNVGEAFEFARKLGIETEVAFETQDGDVITTPASPLRLNRSPVRYDFPPPSIGSDSDRVKAWLSGSVGLDG